VNADDIKKHTHCTAEEAAVEADKLRYELIKDGQSFSFETVLSSQFKIKMLHALKDSNYFIRCHYFVTRDPSINIMRVRGRYKQGGHNVPADKVISRYTKALQLLPEVIQLCDIFNLYDNTDKPVRIFKKHKTKFFRFKCSLWTREEIAKLTGVTKFSKSN
jgi:predicted ABC-type ATPase